MQSGTDSLEKRALQPVPPGARITAVDVLRGFAVFGILVANMASFAGFNTDLGSVGRLDRIILLLSTFLVRAKFYSLFSFLFGWGFAVQMDRAQARGRRFAPFWLRRMLVLLAFGLLHAVFLWTGDILTLYALLGIVLLLFSKRSPRFLLVAIVLCLLFSILWVWPGALTDGVRSAYEQATAFMRSTSLPNSLYGSGDYKAITQLRWQDFRAYLSWTIYSVGNVFAMFLLGLYAGRRNLLRDLDQHLPLVRRVLWVGLAVGVTFNGLMTWAALDPDWLPPGTWRVAPVAFRTIGAPALMLFYASAFLLMMQRESWRQRLEPLSAVGRMALTNYLLQSLAATLIFYGYGLGLYRQVSASFGLLVTVLIYLGQIRFSQGWLKRYRMGPVEWLWRSLAYGRLQPLKRGGRRSGPVSGLEGETASLSARLKLLWGVWILLILWAAGLGVWYFRQEGRLAQAAGAVIVQVPASAPERVSGSQQASQGQTSSQTGNVEEQPDEARQPDVHPVPYRPGPVAADGDPLALAGTFDVDQALREVEILTSAQYAGRQAGSPGGRAAGDYIASQFERYGLQPAGENGTFFQEFEVNYTPLSALPSLVVSGSEGGQREYRAYEDFAPLLRDYAGSGAASGPLWWLNGCDMNDYREVNVAGAVVLCDPQFVSSQQATRYASEHGAAGLLLLSDAEAAPADFAYPLRPALVPKPLPALRVFPALAGDLLAGSGWQLDALRTAGEHFPLDVQVSLEVRLEDNGVCPGPECPARNVLGVLPGRDPEAAGEVIVLGAHYDHMGTVPGGPTWAGANDNASGAALLLEIARSWHEQGYVPRRTVLFAAWDAEELGLLGSYEYVRHPVYPLEDTVAMLQADMVGAGTEVLAIGGEEALSAHLAALAEQFDVPHRVMNVGGSDHRPFLQAGVPAALMIWMSGDEPVTHYHRPEDLPAVIEPGKLEAAGKLAYLALLDLAEGEPALQELIAERAAAVQSGDLEAFLATSLPDQSPFDQAWFEDISQFQPDQVNLNLQNLQVTGNRASGVVEIEARSPRGAPEEDLKSLDGSLRVRFNRTSDGWQWAGPDLVWAQSAAVNPEEAFPVESGSTNEQGPDGENLLTPLPVAYPASAEADLSRVGITATSRYAELAAMMGLPEQADAELLLFPDAGDLRAATALSLPEGTEAWVSAGRVALVYSPRITESVQLEESLAQLTLAQAGVTEAAAPWLWRGLPLALRAEANATAVQRQLLPLLKKELQAELQEEPGLAEAWAAVSVLRERLGWQGLGRFITDLGQRCRAGECQDGRGLDATLQTSLGLDAADFEAAWQSTWRTRLERAQSGLDQVLERRSQAVLTGDSALFLSSVDERIPGLPAEQRSWLTELEQTAVISLTQTARPIALLDDGSILAQVDFKLLLDDQGSNRTLQVEPEVLFLPEGGAGRLRWAGPPLADLAGAQVHLRYPAGEEELAGDMFRRAESILARLAERLELPAGDTGPQLNITLYGDPQAFLAALPPDIAARDNTLSAWSDKAGVRLRQAGLSQAASYDALLAGEIVRWLLLGHGVPDGWLLEGLSQVLTREYGAGRSEAAGLPQVAAELEAGALPPLSEWSPEGENSSGESNPAAARSQAWDAASYLIERYGWDRVSGVLDRLADGAELDAAFKSQLGAGTAQIDQAWRASLARGHAPLEAETLVRSFSLQQAQRHLEVLTGPEMDGRLAGSTGAQAAAKYIAEQFAAYGLQPAGENTKSYFQTFPLTYTAMTRSPRLEVLQGSDPVLGLLMRRDFLPIRLPAGEVETIGELVWWPDPGEPVGDQTGKILLTRRPEDADFALRQAVTLNAAGLLVLGQRHEVVDQYAKQPFRADQVAGIPLLELTLEGSSRFLNAVGRTQKDLSSLEGAEPLGVRVRLETGLSEPQEVQSANVLGLLPGSNPDLRRETLILGAHYDHVGDDLEALLCPSEDLPDGLCEWLPGLRYSGANDDAAGVAVLLEIARLLHESGYRPQRSLLFAAWGAQEYGQLGSNVYLAEPAVPVTNTLGLIQLDGLAGGEGFNLGLQGDWGSEGQLLFSLQTAGRLLGEDVLVTEPVSPSDHLAFRQGGLPGVLAAWRLADENNLPDDLASRVSPARLELSGQVVTLGVLSQLR